MAANISFTRPMEAESTDCMTLDHTKTYVAYLNWGIFENATDTDTKFMWGSKDKTDFQHF